MPARIQLTHGEWLVPQTVPIIRLPKDRDAGGDERPVESGEQACLVRIYPPGVAGSLLPLSTVRNLIGRESACDVELMDDFISREHAVIFQRDGRYFVQDCSSLNGTFVNDRQIDGPQQLVPGDALRMGNHIFKFLSADHVEAQYHEAVYEMMTMDGLTGAHNKRFFEDAIAREMMRAQRHWRPLALLLFDIDHFKDVNDNFGHLAGDECLKQLAVRVRSHVRGEDLFARFGGEEFAIALTEATLKQAARVSRDLCQQVESVPFQTARGSVPMTISIGIGFASGQHPMTAQELIAMADDNLYRAKRDGRNCVRF
jgi:two-component system, cell cycle response regulator